jgi:hypothetical protein
MSTLPKSRLRAVALCALLLAALLPSRVLAFSEIEVREDRDGAGPSHIFQLHDNVVAVVDPLDGAVMAYGGTWRTATRTAMMPAGFRPSRLVRQPSSVIIVSEDERTRIEVARDETQWPREFTTIPHDAAKAGLRPARVVRTPFALTLKARGARALSVRPIGPYYLASVRELERIGDGRRYLLWKEFHLSEPAPGQEDDQRIKVDVYVGRFEKNGTLSGIAPLPLAIMSRVGFDYAAIMPDGTIAVLASLLGRDGKAGPFKIYRLDFETPSRDLVELQRASGKPRRWAQAPPLSNLFPLIEPSDTTVLPSDDDERPAARDAATGIARAAKPSELRRRMDEYRDFRWTLTAQNLRDPCKGEIVPGIPAACTKRSRFVLPPDTTRWRLPVAMKGVPYDWGGVDSLQRFDEKIRSGYVAGNIGGTFWSTEVRRVTAGVDCSGFVSNVWQLGRHVGTGELPEVTRRVKSLNEMRTGDALLLPDHHVALYKQQEAPDGGSLAIRVTEASSRCGAVCDSLYEIDRFQDYALRRVAVPPQEGPPDRAPRSPQRFVKRQ